MRNQEYDKCYFFQIFDIVDSILIKFYIVFDFVYFRFYYYDVVFWEGDVIF